ncbi:MAG: TldD/PmbA family protein [Dehalococcoidales bacterium]|nr:TldD/PmbA family protein [Dehalococcoidales bacterium]
MEHILERARKAAEAAEVFLTSSEETQVRFEANRLKHLQSKQQTGIALRVIKDGRLGYATTTDPAKAAELVESAVETARFGAEVKFEFPGKYDYPRVAVNDRTVDSVPTENMIAAGTKMLDIILRHTPDLVCEAEVSKGSVNVKLLNSRGGQADYRKSFYSIGVGGTLVNGTDMLFVGEGDSSCHHLTDPKDVTDAVLWQLELAKNKATAPTKMLPVVFTPNGFASLVMPLMAAFNGKTVLEGASPIGNKRGQSVYDKKFSLFDDPAISYRPHSRPCDDEGVPSRRTPLVEKGTVKGFIYDLQTAGLAGTKSTGNGNRGRGGPPAPSASAYIITPGDTSFEDMVKDMKEGLVIEQLMGAEQGNILSGDFSGNVLLGFKVENGKIVGRVKDTMIHGNVHQLLKDIAALGDKAHWVGVSLQTPHLYFPAISVASKG